MPVTPTYPGVYVQEEPSGARAIAGVATSVTAFVAMAERGPMRKPQVIFNFADFERNFGATTEGELATQVRNFYLNGGGKAYVMRIAQNPGIGSVELLPKINAANAMTVTARDPGLEGNSLRVEVDYDTGAPEETFNLTVYRSVLKSDGTIERQAEERFENLSMDPDSGFFADKVVNNASALITVQANAPAGTEGISIAGRVLRSSETDVRDDLSPLVSATANALTVQIGNNPPVGATLTPVANVANNSTLTNITDRWKQDIDAALSGASLAVSVKVEIPDPSEGTGANRLLRISSDDGPVRITPGLANDCTVGLMLGTGQGGIEGSDFGDARPAPSGFVARMGQAADSYAGFRAFAGAARTDLTTIDLTDDVTSPAIAQIPVTLPGAGPMFDDGSGINSLGNARAVLDTIAGLITNNSQNRWTAKRHGLRLALTPRYGDEDTGPNTVITSGPGLDLGGYFNESANTAVYKLGTIGSAPGPSAFQGAVTTGSNGNPATAKEYDDAYQVLDRDVDLFNILVLPRNKGQDNAARNKLWGPASAFCEKKRAFLLVDPNDDWTDITKAEKGVDGIRTGVATRNSACYWPRLDMGDKTYVDPSGAIAGVTARTDGNRGVWKAAAGLEATVRGVRGVEHTMTDPENGVINPKALNAIRLFPAGVVSWGARTLVGYNSSGNVDDKYIPVRRTMLFIEESLYRGLRFAVFEPNAEPLWAQIRLAAGSFMNGLFQQGAFKGGKASDAYFVLCDATTTTANDINLGIVNVIVGFAPLKPAEFVILTVKQIAGQTQV